MRVCRVSNAQRLFADHYTGDIAQLALDEERSILYALTKSSKIMSFNIKMADSLTAIQTIANPVGMANAALGGYLSFYQNSVSVVSLSVIPRRESGNYRLMAILSSGKYPAHETIPYLT